MEAGSDRTDEEPAGTRLGYFPTAGTSPQTVKRPRYSLHR
jgi:hypothetical protein